jgi:hypothetical protein
MKIINRAEILGKKQDTRFKPKQSVNPKAKSREVKNHATKLLEIEANNVRR